MDLDKKTLRRRILASCATLSDEAHSRLSAQACDKAVAALAGWAAHQPPLTAILMYMPYRRELDIRPLLDWAAETAAEGLVLPRVSGEGRLQLHRVERIDQLAPGAYGILEPDAAAPHADIAACGLIVLPGVAFDPAGGRLGYGGGYYDRLMADMPHQPLKAAVAFERQLVQQVPMEAHDCRVDLLVTEQQVIWTSVS